MPTTEQLLSLDEVGERAKSLYAHNLKAQVETDDNIGKFITVDVLSGDYEIGTNHIATVEAVRARHCANLHVTNRVFSNLRTRRTPYTNFMITGIVRPTLDAVVTLSAPVYHVGYSILADGTDIRTTLYLVRVLWDGVEKIVIAEETNGTALLVWN